MSSSTLLTRTAILLFFIFQATYWLQAQQGTITSDTTRANKLYETGKELKNSGKYDSGLHYLQAAIDIYKKYKVWERYLKAENLVSESYWRKGDFKLSAEKARMIGSLSVQLLGENNIHQAEAFENLGVINDEQGHPKTSMQYYDKALAIQRKLVGEYHHNTANTYNNIAILMQTMGNNDAALLNYEKSLVIYRKLDGNNSITVANALNNMANVYKYAGEYKKAIALYRESLTIKQRAPGDNRLIAADSYSNLGGVYSTLGDYKEAMKYFQKALELDLEVLPDDHYKVSHTLQRLGSTNYQLGNYDKAQEYYNKALVILKASLGERSLRTAGLYSSMGLLQVDNGNYDLGLDYFQRALDIQNAILGEEHSNNAGIFAKMGAAWLHKNEYEKAQYYFNKTLTIQLADNDRSELGYTYNDLGEVAMYKADYSKALGYFRKSLRLKKEFLGEKHDSYANTLSNIGMTYEKMHNYQQALVYMQKAISIYHQVYGDKHPHLAEVYVNLGTIYQSMREYTHALAAVQKSIMSNVLGFSDTAFAKTPAQANYLHGLYFLNALQLKGTLYKDMFPATGNVQYLHLSVKEFSSCDVLLDQLRLMQQKNEDKISLGNTSATIYKDAIDACMTLHKKDGQQSWLEKAFYFSERSRANVLMQAVASVSARNFGGIPESLLDLEKQLKAERSCYKSLLLAEKSKKEKYDAERVATYQATYFEASNRYDSLVKSFEKNYPQYFRLKYNQLTCSVAGIRKNLPGNNAALVEYFINDTTLYIFLVTKKDFAVLTSSLNRFLPLLQAFRDRIRPGDLTHNPQQAYTDFVSTSQQLYRLLFSGVQHRLDEQINRLVIVPHGVLSLIPFDILVPDKTIAGSDYRALPYLLKDFDISYAYSGTLWINSINRFTGSSWSNQFAGFAPSYKTDLLAQSTELSPYGDFRDRITNLAYTKEEIGQAIGYFPGVTFTGEQATEAAFKKLPGNDRILHLAMHAITDENNPLQSKLIFANSIDSVEDGFLNVYELYNLNLDAELAVLSACNTGYGTLAGGEGVMSLSRAFSYAGCQSLVMSLWEANDKATATIMGLFYKNLADGQTKDQALRAAKLEYLQQADALTAHPYFWAAFIANGNMKPLTQQGFFAKYKWLLLTAAGLLLLAAVIVYRRKRSS